MKNLGLKLVSLLLACVVWFMVSGSRRERPRERIVSASLSLVGMPSDLVITAEIPIPSSVSVRVRGRMSDLRALASQSLEASADLSQITQSGEVEITIRPQHINVP
ncbi:MAG TPA: CdaR family protein, partial [Thermoanaerobaculia bacterium]|nr:CdaR family protein [Thermoanaerobaculia bacterium]